MKNEKTKKCPFCAEEIKVEAIKCKHCGSKIAKNKNIKGISGWLLVLAIIIIARSFLSLFMIIESFGDYTKAQFIAELAKLIGFVWLGILLFLKIEFFKKYFYILGLIVFIINLFVSYYAQVNSSLYSAEELIGLSGVIWYELLFFLIWGIYLFLSSRIKNTYKKSKIEPEQEKFNKLTVNIFFYCGILSFFIAVMWIMLIPFDKNNRTSYEFYSESEKEKIYSNFEKIIEISQIDIDKMIEENDDSDKTWRSYNERKWYSSKNEAIELTKCECDYNTKGCADFQNQESAQRYFECCFSETNYDIHNLDFDNDTIACEYYTY